MNGEHGKIHTEDDWSDESACFPYEKSKLRAEKAAWEYMKDLKEDSNKFKLVCLCPSVVIGPALTTAAQTNTAILVIDRILANKVPAIPNVTFPFVDVRDVAYAFVAAMKIPECAGNRYLITQNETMSYIETANVIAEEFQPQGYKIPTKPIGKLLFWIYQKIDSMGKYIKAIEGKRMEYNNEKMRSVLGIQPLPLKKTILDCCYSLVDLGIVKKTNKYLGHPDSRPSRQSIEENKEDEVCAADKTKTKDEEASEKSTGEKAGESPVEKKEKPSAEEKQEEMKEQREKSPTEEKQEEAVMEGQTEVSSAVEKQGPSDEEKQGIDAVNYLKQEQHEPAAEGKQEETQKVEQKKEEKEGVPVEEEPHVVETASEEKEETIQSLAIETQDKITMEKKQEPSTE